MNLLATLFVALGLVFYLKVRMSSLGGVRKIILLTTVALGFSGLGYLSKENGILLLGYVALVELVVFQDINRWVRARLPHGKAGHWLLGLTLTGLAVITWIVVQPYVDHLIRGYAGRDFTLYERILTQFRAISFYLSQILVPNNGELSMWHDDIQISTGLFSPWTTIVAVITIIGLLALAVVSIFRNRLISFAIFWFFIGHSLESTFIPLEMIHEHRNYLPGFGVSLLLSYLLLSSNMIRPRIALMVAFLCLVFNATVLHARAAVWSSDLTKAAHEAYHHPDSSLAQFSYARFLYAAATKGDIKARDAAEQLLERNTITDEKTIASEMLLVMLAYNAGAEQDQAWIDSAISKLDKVGYSAINSRALSGVLDYLKENREQDWRFVDRLYRHLENFEHPQFLTFAGIFHLEITRDVERGYALLEKVVRITKNRPAYRLNLMRAQLKLRLISNACVSLVEMEAMPVEDIVLFQAELNQMREWLGDRCT